MPVELPGQGPGRRQRGHLALLRASGTGMCPCACSAPGLWGGCVLGARGRAGMGCKEGIGLQRVERIPLGAEAHPARQAAQGWGAAARGPAHTEVLWRQREGLRLCSPRPALGCMSGRLPERLWPGALAAAVCWGLRNASKTFSSSGALLSVPAVCDLKTRKTLTKSIKNKTKIRLYW